MTAITDRKLRDKLMKKETQNEENNRNDQTKYIRKEKRQKHSTGSTNIEPKIRN